MKLGDTTYKKRTVKDLIRFIRNSTDNSQLTETKRIPSYSILLGAGASVTSGIRSGQKLIDTWKEEVYQELGKDKYESVSKFFESVDKPEWYDETNPYSALFENRFDLQRHRRMFVENEVAGKTPSIGYAYLVKLIENGYFNTVFTTNFDDLLNEAFYRFSKNRPIVCAHDSSISGVTVTSSRPKIIKLHGDYLFDDIKATLRETESLESNMKMKFQEFAKDFGLIVVGYAGNDRSIMDILTYLLQQDEYFKNGIYWCVRKSESDSNINNELKKLLWRDRVFYVEIDGFDEFFAELNHDLNDGNLPIDTSFLSRSHQEKILKDLTENQLLNLSNPSSHLAKDCKRLKDHFEGNFMNDYIQFMRNRNSNNQTENIREYTNRNVRRKINLKPLDKEQKKEIYDLNTELFVFNKKNEVLLKLKNINVFDLEDNLFKLELIELETDLTRDMDDETIRKYFDELIRLAPEEEKYYVIASNRSKHVNQKLDYLKRASEKFYNDEYIINRYISALIDFADENLGEEQNSQILSLIESNIEKSLKLNNSITNSVYYLKSKYNRIKYHAEDLKEKNEELCNKLWELSKTHPNTIRVLNDTQSSKLNETIIKESIEFYSAADDEENIERLYIELLNLHKKKDNIDTILAEMKNYEEAFIPSDNYKLKKAEILMNYEYLEDAYDIFMQLPKSFSIESEILTVLCYLEKKEEFEEYYEKNKDVEGMKENYLSLSERYYELEQFYKDKIQNGQTLSKNEAIPYSFSLLKLGKYQEVKNVLKKYYDNPNLCDGVIIVNYLFAEINLNPAKKDKSNKKLQEKIIESKYFQHSEFEKFGAWCVIGDLNNMRSGLSKVLKESPIKKYEITTWPIIEFAKTNEKISKLLTPNRKKLSNN